MYMYFQLITTIRVTVKPTAGSLILSVISESVYVEPTLCTTKIPIYARVWTNDTVFANYCVIMIHIFLFGFYQNNDN